MHLLPKWILASCLVFTAPAATLAQAQDDAEEAGETHEQHEQSLLKLTAAEQEAAGVVIGRVEKRTMAEEIAAPGEVTLNIYRSAQVTPRIEAQVVKRHAYLGDIVKREQPLVTLSSVEMAKAQGELIVADRDWERVQGLGADIVSAQRYVEAQVARQQVYARVQAFGMTSKEIDALLEEPDAANATGRFDLAAPQDGTVISDDFVAGEMVQPGHVLFEITDVSVRWVEAQLSPENAARVDAGGAARVSVDGQRWVEGIVAQIHPALDETTRTRAVRIDVHNNPNVLQPGQFVQTALQTTASQPVIAVPDQAVTLMQGATTVFKAQGDEFHPQKVETGRSYGGRTEIRMGLRAGDLIAVKGLFYLKSLVLKSEIGDVD